MNFSFNSRLLEPTYSRNSEKKYVSFRSHICIADFRFAFIHESRVKYRPIFQCCRDHFLRVYAVEILPVSILRHRAKRLGTDQCLNQRNRTL